MTKSLGGGTHLDIISADEGPNRKLTVFSFESRTDTGAINHPILDASQHVIAVVDMKDGSLRTSEFTDILATGSFSQTDTGPGGVTCFAVITDTGL